MKSWPDEWPEPLKDVAARFFGGPLTTQNIVNLIRAVMAIEGKSDDASLVKEVMVVMAKEIVRLEEENKRLRNGEGPALGEDVRRDTDRCPSSVVGSGSVDYR